MKKKQMAALMLLCLCLMLSACAQKPASIGTASPETLVDANADDLPGDAGRHTLYFQLGDEPYLVAEDRQFTVRQDETEEMALIRQLLAGPSATRTALSPLFPEGTEVIATSLQGETLFVTFNEAFLSGYRAEKSNLSGDQKTQAIRAERQLCLDALAATLTDAGLCTKVQVLVHRDQVQGNSLRLTEDYLHQNGSTLPLDSIVRREESLYTPYNAAKHILSAWMARDFSRLKGCICAKGHPGEQVLQERLGESAALTGFQLSQGQPAPDGKVAIVTAEITLYKDGNTWTKKGYPLALRMENGVWKLHYDTLCSMMAEE